MRYKYRTAAAQLQILRSSLHAILYLSGKYNDLCMDSELYQRTNILD
jgi:hypothetical protein